MSLPKSYRHSLSRNGGSPITNIDVLLGIKGKPRNDLIGRCIYVSDVDGKRKEVRIKKATPKETKTVVKKIIEVQKKSSSFKSTLSEKRLQSALRRVKDGEDMVMVARAYRVQTAYLKQYINTNNS